MPSTLPLHPTIYVLPLEPGFSMGRTRDKDLLSAELGPPGAGLELMALPVLGLCSAT